MSYLKPLPPAPPERKFRAATGVTLATPEPIAPKQSGNGAQPNVPSETGTSIPSRPRPVPPLGPKPKVSLTLSRANTISNKIQLFTERPLIVPKQSNTIRKPNPFLPNPPIADPNSQPTKIMNTPSQTEGMEIKPRPKPTVVINTEANQEFVIASAPKQEMNVNVITKSLKTFS